MRKRLWAVLAPVLWCSSAWGQAAPPSFWRFASNPGAGGAFTCVDVSSNGRVLVGSDVSCIYSRDAAASDWTRRGTLDGLLATSIRQVKFCPVSSDTVYAGTDNGLWRSGDAGATWSRVHSDYNEKDVTAMTWGRGDESRVFYFAYNARDGSSGSTGTLNVYRSEDGTASSPTFTSVSHGISASPNRQPIKIVIDPNTSGSTDRDVYLLFGKDGAVPGTYESSTVRELWRSTTAGSSCSQISMPDTDPDPAIYPIDLAFGAAAGTATVTTSDGSQNDDNDSGKVYEVTSLNGTADWTLQTLNTTGSGTATGAVWYNAARDVRYILSVQRDPCDPQGCLNSAPAAAGLWSSPAGDGTWDRTDDGLGNITGTTCWDWGWTNCNTAYGQAIDNVCNAISADAGYRVTAQYVYHYVTSPSKKYASSYTSGSASAWSTKLIENVNPAAISSSGGPVYVGYYDIGLW